MKNDIKIVNINNDLGLTYDIKTESTTLMVKGLMKNLSDVHLESMSLTVDIQGLGEGTHKIPLNINLPSSVTLMQEAFVEVSVKKVEPTVTTQ